MSITKLLTKDVKSFAEMVFKMELSNVTITTLKVGTVVHQHVKKNLTGIALVMEQVPVHFYLSVEQESKNLQQKLVTTITQI